MPKLKKHFGAHDFGDWKAADVLQHVRKLERGLIRVDADEVTYPMHVILRYELEQDLIGGKMKPADIPEAWDAKMKDYLGLSTINNMKDGPMQDVHWPSGAFGYFPSYTLGAMMAAQQWAAIERANPDVNKDIRKGDFAYVSKWRRDNIWSKASFASTNEIMKKATGETLNANYFINHLKKRYG